MPREFSRASRMAAQVQREIADLFSRGVGDPRLHAATVSRVKVSKDLTRATVYLEVPGSQQLDEILHAATKARAFLRHQLAHRIRTRALPQLEFAWDSETARANRVLTLIESMVGSEPERPDAAPKQEEER